MLFCVFFAAAILLAMLFAVALGGKVKVDKVIARWGHE
jgi:hypothetical protein